MIALPGRALDSADSASHQQRPEAPLGRPNAFVDLGTAQLPALQRQSAACATSDRPDTYHPLGLGEMAKLKMTAVLGQIATSLIAGSVFITGINYLSDVGSKWCLGALAVVTVTTLMASAYGIFAKPKKVPCDGEFAESRARVQEAVARLGPEFGSPKVDVVPVEKPIGFLILNRLLYGNTLVYDPRVERRLSDAQLDGIAAHELAHCGRSWTPFEMTSRVLRQLAYPATFWAASHAAFSSLAPTGVVGTSAAVVAALLVGTLSSMAARSVSSVPSSLATRANEILTDRRALLVTRNQAAYESGLQAIERDLRSAGETTASLGKLIFKISQPISSHPRSEERFAYLRNKLATLPGRKSEHYSTKPVQS